MAIKFFCDVCGKEIKDQVYNILVSPVDILSIDCGKCLCVKCLGDLEKFLNKQVGNIDNCI